MIKVTGQSLTMRKFLLLEQQEIKRHGNPKRAGKKIEINFWTRRVAQDHGKSDDDAKTPAAKNEAKAVNVTVIPLQQNKGCSGVN